MKYTGIKFKGYMSLEASYIFPIVLGIIYMIIATALSLFAFCYNSQKEYVNALKDIRITSEEGIYKEVIYSDIREKSGKCSSGLYRVNPLEDMGGME